MFAVHLTFRTNICTLQASLLVQILEQTVEYPDNVIHRKSLYHETDDGSNNLVNHEMK